MMNEKVCKSCQVDPDINDLGYCRECYADAQAYQMIPRSCFCVGKMPWCTCGQKCRCLCTCPPPKDEEMYNANWTKAEVKEIREGAKLLADDLLLDNEFVEELVSRTLDIRDCPEKFMTLDEFIEKFDEKEDDST